MYYMCMKREMKTFSLDWRTIKVLRSNQLKTGVPMSRQIDFKVLGKSCGVKKVGEI